MMHPDDRYWHDAGYTEGLRDGMIVGAAIIAWAVAIHDRTWFCNPSGTAEGRCPGQNFIPADVNAEWRCWICGALE